MLVPTTGEVVIEEGEDTDTLIVLNECYVTSIIQQYETPVWPRGYIFKFVLFTTWGDRFYAGLNGLELYDQVQSLASSLLVSYNLFSHFSYNLSLFL